MCGTKVDSCVPTVVLAGNSKVCSKIDVFRKKTTVFRTHINVCCEMGVYCTDMGSFALLQGPGRLSVKTKNPGQVP